MTKTPNCHTQQKNGEVKAHNGLRKIENQSDNMGKHVRKKRGRKLKGEHDVKYVDKRDKAGCGVKT